MDTSDLVDVKQLPRGLKLEDVDHIKLYCDNQAALHTFSNSVFH